MKNKPLTSVPEAARCCNGLSYLLAFLCVLFLAMPMAVWGQTKEYATVTPSSGRERAGVALGIPGSYNSTTNNDVGQVMSPLNAGTADSTTFATLNAGMSVVLGTGFYGQSWVQLKFDHSVPANTPTYIRLGDLEKEGGGLDVLGLVTGDILGLITNEIVVPTAYKNATSASDGTTVSASTNILRGQDGFLYAVVTPTEAYNSVRIRLRNADNPLLGLLSIEFSKLQLKVYNAFYYDDLTECSPALFSDLGKTIGISVNLGDVVKNPSFAIDDNTSSYSQISTGALAVAASAAQNIYFPALSEPTSTLKVRLGIESSALNLDLLGAYRVRVFNGNTLVQEFPLQSGLVNGLDLLGLLGNNGATTVSFSVTEGAYDRVEIGLNTTVGLNLAASTLRIYDVSRSSVNCPEPPPTVNPLISPVCANVDIVSADFVDDAAYATDGNFDSYASIRSGTGILLGLGNRSGHLEVSFPSTGVPANKTTYIRIDYDVEVLNALLAGSLGNTVGGLVNGLLLGEHYFDIHLTNAGSNVLQTSSIDNFNNANGQVRIVQDAAGRYYIAIKSNAPFTNLRITDHTSAVVGLLAPDQFLNVYSICYEASEAICDPAFSTSYEGSGITLDLLQLGNNGVENAHYAIDDNDATASKINLGLLSVAGSMSQYIHFNSLSDPQSVFKIKLAIAASETLNVDLLGAYEIIAYNGATEVYRRSLGGGLLNGTDVLGLLGGGQPGTLTFAPGKAFDRIEIRVNGLVGASAFESSVEVYDVKRYGPAGSECEDPDFVLPPSTPTPFEDPSCEATVVAWGNADYPHLAADGNNESFATLTASSGQLLGIGAYNGFLEYEFPTAIPANKTTYIRIAMEDDLLSRLLSGTLGTLVNTVGGLLLGDHYFSVEAKTAQTGGNTVLTGSSQAAFSDVTGGDLRIVQDNVGRYYIAVTPNAAYSNIRITEHFPALVGTTQDVASMNIYEACFEMGEDVCLPGQFTSFDVAGVNLGALDAAGVINPDHAISANSSYYSEISTGTVAVAAEVSQRVYFNKLSTAGDTLKVRLQLDPSSLASVDLLGRYRIVTYNGSEVAETFTLQQGLINNLNLLNLFSSGGIQTLTYHTDVPYDRVDIVVGSLLNVALTPSVRLYEVKRIGEDCPSTTVPSPFENPVCVTTLVAAANADNIDNLFDDDFDSYATLNSGAGVLLGLGNKYEGYVELGFGEKIPANKTAYVRIDFEPTLLNHLLGGSIGGALAGVVDNLVLGDHYFTVQVKDGATTVLQGGSNDNFGNNNDRIRIVQDNAGRYYIALTPGAEYDAIRISDNTNSALGLLAQPNSMNVYGACVDNPLTDCQPVFTTSYDATGLTLDAAGLSGSGVKDASHAIDINTTNYSEISLGTVAVGSAVKQIFDFRKLAQPGEVVNLRLQYGEGALDANLIGGLEIVAYNGVTPVATLDVQSALINGLNVLDILNNSSIGIIPFAPEVEFDRVSVGLRGVVGVSVLPALRVYAVEKDCNTPIFEAWKSYTDNTGAPVASVSGGEEITYTIHIQNTGMVDLEDYIVTDQVPDNTTYVAGSGGTLDNGTVTFTGINVAAGATATVSFKVLIDEDLTDVNAISNVAFVKLDAADPGQGTVPPADPNDPTAGPDPDATPGTTTDIPVDPIHSVVSWKAYTVEGDATTTSVSGGETIVYSIFVRNTGNQALTNVEVSDLLPPGVSYVSGGTLAGNTVSFTIPTLAVGATSGAQEFTVEVNDNLNNISVIRNVAVVSGDDLPPTDSYPPLDNENPTDPDDTGDTGTDIPVVPTDDIVAWKGYSIDGDPATSSVSGGEEITYTIYIRNESNQNLTDLSVSDAIPAGTTFVSAGNGGISNGTIVEFTGINIDFGQTASVSFVVTVNENLTGIDAISNVAFVKKDATDPDPGQGTVPPVDPTNPSSGPDPAATPGTPTNIPVDAIYTIDLSLAGVSQGANSGQAAPADVINYVVTITNNGNKDLTNILLVDAIPANTSLDNAGDFTLNGTDLELTIPTLAVGETKTFSFTVTVDPMLDPNMVSSIDNNVVASNSEVSETATHTMPTSCTPVVAGDLILTTSPDICLGQSLILSADLTGAPSGVNPSMVKWYTAYNGATGALSGFIGSGESITYTPDQVGTVTYYAVIEGVGFCFNNPPATVTVIINALPTTPSITASATTICEGEGFTLTATAGADSYKWFRDNVELAGETNSTLTVAAAQLADAGQYSVVAVNSEGCESAVSVGTTISVTPRATVNDIAVTGNENAVCEGTSVTLEVSSTSITNPVFRWYAEPELTNLLFTGTTLTINPATNTSYFVTVEGDGVCENAALNALEVEVEVNPISDFTVDGALSYSIEVGNSVGLPTITAANVTWYNHNGQPHVGTQTEIFDTPGTYTYTAVIAEADHCTVTVSVIINVYAEGECPPVYDRIYATDASDYRVSNLLGIPLGGIDNAADAADGDINSFSELTEGVNALGLLGQTYQTLKWSAPVAAGTPVSVKLGKQFSTVNVLGTLRIVPVDASGNSVGVSQSVEPNILNALGGINVYDYKFTPTDASGQPVVYSGVKIYYQGAVSLLQTARIYEAYYHEVGAVDCGDEEVLDVLHGVENPISGLGVANALIGVTDPEHVIDNDETTYAVMSNVAAVNAQTRLEVRYNNPGIAGDEVRILLSQPGGLLEVEALTSFTIQPYLGDAPVGEPITDLSNLLRIELLGGGNQAEVIYSADRPFDRIKILFGGVTNVLGQLNVHEITRDVPQLELGENGDNVFEICAGEDIVIDPDDCTSYVIYDALTGGTVVDITELAPGTHTLYVQTVRFGACEVGTRTEITVTVNALPDAPAVTNQELCQTAVSTPVNYLVDVPADHVAVYYANANPTSTPLSTVPTVDQNVPGAYTVYVSLRNTLTGCEGPRVAVSIVVNETPAPALTELTQTFCEIDSATVADLNTAGATGDVVWYTSATGGTALAPTAALVAGTYYAAQIGDDCESVARTEVTVEITETPAPALTELTQTFCEIDMPTVADLNTTGASGTVVWYTSATGGTALAPTAALVAGTYYAAQIGDDCESVDRTEVTVVITETPAPALTELTQTFCEIDSATVADLNTAGATGTVVWYASATGGTALAPTAALVAGTYYAAQIGDDCESVARTEVTVEIANAAAPTIDDATPEYCAHEGMTLADLPVVGTGIKWYDSAVGGTLLPGTTVMQDGVTYYASQTADNTCESIDRLAVTPTITDCLAILSVEKLADQDRVVAGTNTSFTLTITNDGPGIVNAGEQIIVKEEPSAGLTITGFSIEDQAGTVTYDENTATATVTVRNAIPMGGTISVKVLAAVDADAPATIRNKVLVWGPDTPPTDNPDDEDETPPIPVDREYNLTIDKVADEARVKAGEPTTFTVTITNNGPSVMEIGKAIALLERPGEGVTIDGYTILSGNATVSGAVNNATVTTTAKLPVNGTITLRIDATVDEDAPEQITNGITVWGPGKDPEDDPKDDDGDTPPIPVDFPLIDAQDDFAEVKLGLSVTIPVLTNDVVTKWDIDPATVEITTQPSAGTVEVLPNGQVVYTAPRDQIGNVQFAYRVRDVKGRWSNVAMVNVTVLENPLEIPNVITPNGDEYNDKFEIRGLELYDNVHLTIMNRWGSEVYRNSEYNNEWRGQGLNEGTYFYVLKLIKDGRTTTYSGSVLIKRN